MPPIIGVCNHSVKSWLTAALRLLYAHVRLLLRYLHSLMDSLTIRVAPGPINAEIAVPGSKSITNRALVLAALADGDSTLDNALFSDDSKVCAECLRGLGIAIEADEEAARIVVHGMGGVFPAKSASLFVGNSGTTARFVTAPATLGHCDYPFHGVPRMPPRPR